MTPRDHLSVRVEPGIDAFGGDGVIVGVLQIILARPGHFHRSAVHRLRQHRRLEHEVAFRLAAEAATEQRDVDGHVLFLQAELFGEFLAGVARALHAGPSLALPVDDTDGCAWRLHRRVSTVRDVILRRHDLGGGRQRFLGIAVVAHDLARPPCGLLDLRLESRRIVGAVRSIIPGRIERLAPLDRRPGIARDDRDAAERLEFAGAGVPSIVTTFSTPGTFMAAEASKETTLPPNTGGRATTAYFMPGSFASTP